MIGVDWGGTHVRAYAFNQDGALVAKCAIEANGAHTHSEQLTELADHWLTDNMPVLMCGMVGSRHGWVEAPYVPCPWDLNQELPLTRVPERPHCWILPGLRLGHEDVLRGEETQLLGVAAPGASGLFVMPGTHSKWVQVRNGVVESFTTFLTGELFNLLRTRSNLTSLMIGVEFDATAFAAGVERARSERCLSSSLFKVRTNGLFDAIAPHQLASFLSGILIGSELIEALSRYDDPSPVTLICSATLRTPYLAAFEHLGRHDVVWIDGSEAVARGLWTAGRALRNTV